MKPDGACRETRRQSGPPARRAPRGGTGPGPSRGELPDRLFNPFLRTRLDPDEDFLQAFRGLRDRFQAAALPPLNP